MLLLTNENHTGTLHSEIEALKHTPFLETLTGTSDQGRVTTIFPILAAKIQNVYEIPQNKRENVCILFEIYLGMAI